MKANAYSRKKQEQLDFLPSSMNLDAIYGGKEMEEAQQILEETVLTYAGKGDVA